MVSGLQVLGISVSSWLSFFGAAVVWSAGLDMTTDSLNQSSCGHSCETSPIWHGVCGGLNKNAPQAHVFECLWNGITLGHSVLHESVEKEVTPRWNVKTCVAPGRSSLWRNEPQTDIRMHIYWLTHKVVFWVKLFVIPRSLTYMFLRRKASHESMILVLIVYHFSCARSILWLKACKGCTAPQKNNTANPSRSKCC